MKKKQENILKKISKQSIGVELPIDTDMDGDVDNMDEQIKKYLIMSLIKTRFIL